MVDKYRFSFKYIIVGCLIVLVILAIYFYDDMQRENDYQFRYEIAMETYDNELLQYTQCSLSGSQDSLDILIRCGSRPSKPFIFRRSRIFKLPFLD